MDPTSIEGVIPSAQLRAALAGQTALLAFSRGKDSIAAWLALRDAGVRVIPYHLYLIPGLAWVGESLAYYEDWFGTKIINLPHPSLYRWLANLMYQPPERCRIIEAAQITVPTYAMVNAMLREHFGLLPDAWVCDGVRAADSPRRRAAIARHGPVSGSRRTQKVVWDWRKQHVMDAIRGAGVELPPDYAWFGRSFDGLDRRFLGPVRQHVPGDYARILEWFPLAALELRRPAPSAARQGPGRVGFRERAAREEERFRLATDSEYWVALCFRTPDGATAFASALGLTSHGRYVPGPQLEAALVGRTYATEAEIRTASVDLQVASRPAPDPFAAAACTGDLAADADAELAALLAALNATPDPDPASVLDSQHHLIAWWPARAAKDAWLAATGLGVLGDKYLDGDAAATILGIALPPRQTAVRSSLAARLRLSRPLALRRSIERTSRAQPAQDTTTALPARRRAVGPVRARCPSRRS
jgi:hypothetical protein